VADIFISYASADKSLAQDLANSLLSEGYSVDWDRSGLNGDDLERKARESIKNAEVVLVLWSENSVQSEWVMNEAHLANLSNKLLPIKLAGLDQTRIPLLFNNIATLNIDSLEHIKRALTGLGLAPPAPLAERPRLHRTGRGPLYALSGHRRPDGVPSQAAERAQPGKLFENIPRLMRAQIPLTVEVRISQANSDAMLQGFAGDVQRHDVLTTRAMTVSLQSPDGGFAIQNLSRETQWIDGSHRQQLGLLSQENYGSWKWIVTPLQRGEYKLNIIAAAKTSDEGGLQAEIPFPEQVVEVRVRVNYYENVKAFGQWLLVGAAGGLVAEYAPKLIKLINS